MAIKTIDEVFRDFETDGVPASGPHKPIKVDIRDTLNDKLNLTFLQDGSGAVARPLVAKIKDGPVSLEDFGYVSGNALTALNNAIGCGQPIQLGPKQYDVDGVATAVSNRPFVLMGHGFGASALRFIGPYRGLSINQADFNDPTHISDLSFITTQAEPDNAPALDITYTKSDSITNRNQKRCELIDLDIRGENFLSHGWKTGIKMLDVHNADIIRPVIVGRRSSPTGVVASFSNMADGIVVQGSDTPTLSSVPSDVWIDAPKIDTCVNAIRAFGEVEGLVVDNPFLVGVVKGVVGNMTTERPWVSVRGGHMNVFTRGVDLTNCPQSNISDMLIYKFEFGLVDTIAVALNNSDDCKISNLTLMNNGVDKATSGDWYGVNLVNSDRCDIDTILHNRPSGTVVITGTSTGNTGRNVKAMGSYAGATQEVWNDTSSGVNFYGNTITAGKNTGSIASVTNTGTAIGSTNLAGITVTKGEKYRVTVKTAIAKGATPGLDAVEIAKSAGTATVTFNFDEALLSVRTYSEASTTMNIVVTGVMNVLGTGTITLGFTGFSFGSNGSIAAGGTQFNIERI